MHLANRTEADALEEKAKHAYDAWLDGMPTAVRDTHVHNGMHTETSDQAKWDACERTRHMASAWIRNLTVN
jgi:Asp-tRNA(Asn)/Glu-tRNA(Gln) amidotransferase A subunit family amidase